MGREAGPGLVPPAAAGAGEPPAPWAQSIVEEAPLTRRPMGWTKEEDQLWDAARDGKDGEIERLIAARLEARKAKDFTAADAIRDELAGQGIALEDGPEGTTWRRA